MIFRRGRNADDSDYCLDPHSLQKLAYSGSQAEASLCRRCRAILSLSIRPVVSEGRLTSLLMIFVGSSGIQCTTATSAVKVGCWIL